MHNLNKRKYKAQKKMKKAIQGGKAKQEQLGALE